MSEGHGWDRYALESPCKNILGGRINLRNEKGRVNGRIRRKKDNREKF